MLAAGALVAHGSAAGAWELGTTSGARGMHSATVLDSRYGAYQEGPSRPGMDDTTQRRAAALSTGTGGVGLASANAAVPIAPSINVYVGPGANHSRPGEGPGAGSVTGLRAGAGSGPTQQHGIQAMRCSSVNAACPSWPRTETR
jgi:hypothetical protein